jgi:hypothetical protein
LTTTQLVYADGSYAPKEWKLQVGDQNVFSITKYYNSTQPESFEEVTRFDGQKIYITIKEGLQYTIDIINVTKHPLSDNNIIFYQTTIAGIKLKVRNTEGGLEEDILWFMKTTDNETYWNNVYEKTIHGNWQMEVYGDGDYFIIEGKDINSSDGNYSIGRWNWQTSWLEYIYAKYYFENRTLYYEYELKSEELLSQTISTTRSLFGFKLMIPILSFIILIRGRFNQNVRYRKFKKK